MSLTLTYDGTLSRVRVTAAGLTAPSVVQVQRSVDQITWTTVRGGADVTPTGGTVQVDDYEFAPDVPNYYRVVGPSRWDAFGRSVASGWGTADSGQAWTVFGGPAADYLVTAGTGRHSHSTINIYRRSLLAGTGTDAEVVRDVTVPVAASGAAVVTGTVLRWTDGSNFYWLRTEFSVGGTVMAKITKRVAGVDTELAVANPVPSLTYSAGVPLRSRARIVGTRLYLRIWPAASPEPVGWTLTAADASLTGAGQVGEQTWIVGGNTNPLPVVVQHDNWALTLPVSVLESDSLTPTIGGVWLKSVARPFLNRQVTVMDYSDVERSSRAGLFDVIGRSYPVAVSDVRGSRRWTLEVLTQTLAEAADVDLILASGDPLFVQVPADCDVPGGYVTVGDTTQRRTARRTTRRVFSLPCVEIAAPGPDVVGATVNWQTVLSTYPTWADLMAAHPTWQDLLELVGSPTDVVVP